MSTDFVQSFRLSTMRVTPYPNRLLELTATLPETQVRIVNMIVRLTLGWRAGSPGERQAYTTISLWRLKARVGRSHIQPIVEAVAALVRNGVFDVRETDGASVDLASLRDYGRPLRIGIARSWGEEA